MPLSTGDVRFTVTTNMPTPVEVMAGLDLKGQAPQETHIGRSQRITLTGPTTSFAVSTAMNERKSNPLPDGDYIAEVSFYPPWGAKNGNPDARQITHEVHGSDEIVLKMTGRSIASVKRHHRLQKWVMENLYAGVAWNAGEMERRLGSSVVSSPSGGFVKDHYFANADMTVVVNHYLKEVMTWRFGR
ncbi:MAG: hypothetical protein AAGI68_14205 [Planctomycetota bacterium]